MYKIANSSDEDSGVFRNLKGGSGGTFQVYIFKCSSFSIFFHNKISRPTKNFHLKGGMQAQGFP